MALNLHWIIISMFPQSILDTVARDLLAVAAADAIVFFLEPLHTGVTIDITLYGLNVAKGVEDGYLANRAFYFHETITINELDD